MVDRKATLCMHIIVPGVNSPKDKPASKQVEYRSISSPQHRVHLLSNIIISGDVACSSSSHICVKLCKTFLLRCKQISLFQSANFLLMPHYQSVATGDEYYYWREEDADGTEGRKDPSRSSWADAVLASACHP